MNEIAAFTYAAMLHFAPPELLPQWSGFEETLEQRYERYAEIANTVGDVCQTRRCAAFLVAMGAQESHFALDADRGPKCYSEGKHKSRCDGGRAASVWQVHAHCAEWSKEEPGKCADEVTVSKLFQDRAVAARAVWNKAKWSMKFCKNLTGLTGGCIETNRSSAKQALAREALWRKVQAWKPR